jgi:signal transduction histidine kinase
LLAAAGFAWFAPDFSATGAGALDWIAAHLLYLHRGPLVQLALTYPRGRARHRFELVVVAIAYAAALVVDIWSSPVATLALVVLFVGAATPAYRRALGAERRARRYALIATAFLAAVLAAIALVHLVAPIQTVKEETLLAYEAGLCVLAVSLLVGLLRAPWERAEVTDLVVELGEQRSGSLRDALARALGDPMLEIGYALPGTDAYVDASGRTLDPTRPGSNRRVTRLERGGRTIAAVVHDEAVLDDPGLVEGIAAATRLTASNARLQAELRVQVDEVQASRRRLLVAGDEERRRLGRKLDEGAASRLAALAELLARARMRAEADVLATIERAEDQLARSRTDLRALAAGLHPRELTENGLAAVLASLAESSQVTVELTVPVDRVPSDVEAAAYFVCSEALANVAKYAKASQAAVTVTIGVDAVRVEIADDGIGGADPTGGTGLRGLSDRVEALGGTFSIESPVGGGSRLVAQLPLTESA